MEETETAKMHWGALKRMILDRGGFPGMKSNLILHTKLLWYLSINFVVLILTMVEGVLLLYPGQLTTAIQLMSILLSKLLHKNPISLARDKNPLSGEAVTSLFSLWSIGACKSCGATHLAIETPC